MVNKSENIISIHMKIVNSQDTNLLFCIKMAHTVRKEVFQDEQGISQSLDFDGKDNDCIQILALDNEVPVGTVRLRNLSKDIAKVERLAVISAYRKMGVGNKIMLEVLNVAKKQNIKHLVLDAQVSAKIFYEKLGFIAEGDVFQEVGIPHIKMILDIY